MQKMQPGGEPKFRPAREELQREERQPKAQPQPQPGSRIFDPLLDPRNPSQAGALAFRDSLDWAEAARRLHIEIQWHEFRSVGEIEERIALSNSGRKITEAQHDCARLLSRTVNRLLGEDWFGADPEVLAGTCFIIAGLGRPSLLCSGMHQVGRIAAACNQVWSSTEAGGATDADALEDSLSVLIESVGRIEPLAGGHGNYLGTGFLVDESPQGTGLVVTNAHVAERLSGNPWWRISGSVWELPPGSAFIDFDGSKTRDRDARAPVLNIYPHPQEMLRSPSFERLDMALLEVDLEPVRRLWPKFKVRPLPLDWTAVHSSLDLGHLLVCGFPGRMNWTGEIEGRRVADIAREIFGEDYGFKRISPGVVRGATGFLGSSDPRQWVFGHDATGSHGNSGSPVLAVETTRAFGVHFAGGRIRNFAHALSEAGPMLRAMCAPTARTHWIGGP